MKQIDHLIINSPYEEPSKYWSYNREKRTFSRVEGKRRPAGYVVATPDSQSFDDPGIFIELPIVNKIRKRIKEWRNEGYPRVTGITKRLLEHWRSPEERDYRKFFFCQLQAIETLIWLNEAPAASRQGIDIESDGGQFSRYCSKMATGSGKTIIMAMIIAWHTLNKVTYPQDKRFSKNILIIAPGLTVKSRLQVLQPYGFDNYYDEFNIVPPGMIEKLRRGKVIIHNWHALNWESEERIKKKKGVDKRGAKSDEAYVREVLGDMASSKRIVVINDEAHHAWRVPAESKIKGVKKEEIEEATKWVGGLDRIHKAREIMTCYDLSATPFAPSGKKSSEEALFGWIVSDFGLNDAIESGLVKTPRVVIRDDGQLAPDYKSRLYHIYNDPEVKDDLSRAADENEPLPDLVSTAYVLLGKDWHETFKRWKKQNAPTPPVMITVCNRTETAARVKNAFMQKRIFVDELTDPEKILHIDSKVLEKAESKEEAISLNNESEEGEKKKLTKEKQAELLRQQVDTVGQTGKPGGKIQKVISVGMLSEGWDAKTVTHIMGLRAFSSQLLCEQVVGRGLRRTSYDVNPKTGFFEAEYVNIFGIPFTFLPHEGGEGSPPTPPDPKSEIRPDPEKREYEISWPNVIRIEHTYEPRLTLNLDNVDTIELNALNTPTIAEMAPVVEGRPNVEHIAEIDLKKLGDSFRTQRIVFETARNIYEQMKAKWKGNSEFLLAQVINIVEKFIKSDKVQILPSLFNRDDLRRRIIITLNMSKIGQHIIEAIRFENTASLAPVFDKENPIRNTGDMRTWYTSKPCEYTRQSHINLCVFDGRWEAFEAFELDRNSNVSSWVKNDHLGYAIHYIFKGVVKRYFPDFLIRLKSGKMLVLEVKGQDSQQNQTKRKFLGEWVDAVNQHGGFGKWAFDVSLNPSDLVDILDRHSN